MLVSRRLSEIGLENAWVGDLIGRRRRRQQLENRVGKIRRFARSLSIVYDGTM